MAQAGCERSNLSMPIDGTTAAVISETAQSDIFDFFGLPRELRGWVYGYVFEDRTTPRLEREQTNTGDYRGRIPFVNARLISRQFRLEYDQVSRVHHLLRMEDHPQVSMDEPDSVSIHQWFKKSVDFEITFLVTWYGDTYESEDYHDLDEGMSLLERILGDFDDLEKLRITVSFVKRTGASTVWAHIQSNILCLSKLRCTRQIQVVGVVPGRLGSEGGSDNGSFDGENSDSEDPDGDTDDSESEVDADAEELSQSDIPDCGYPDDSTWDFVYQGDQPRR